MQRRSVEAAPRGRGRTAGRKIERAQCGPHGASVGNRRRGVPAWRCGGCRLGGDGAIWGLSRGKKQLWVNFVGQRTRTDDTILEAFTVKYGLA